MNRFVRFTHGRPIKRSKTRDRRGFAPDPTGEAYCSAPQIPYSWWREGNIPSELVERVEHPLRTGGERGTSPPKNAIVSALPASLFARSDLAIFVDPHTVVDRLAPIVDVDENVHQATLSEDATFSPSGRRRVAGGGARCLDGGVLQLERVPL